MMVVIGGTGGLGQGIQPYFPSAFFAGSADVSILDPVALENFFKVSKPTTVVNLAGFHKDGFLHKQDQSELDRMIDVNVRGTVNLLRYALPGMRERRKGRIILASSFLAREPVLGTGVYAASKSFIDEVVRNCALENARYGITCNAIRLGYFDGGMTHRINNWEDLRKTIPVGRFGVPEELVKTINYIIETEYLNGATIDLTGGL